MGRASSFGVPPSNQTTRPLNGFLSSGASSVCPCLERTLNPICDPKRETGQRHHEREKKRTESPDAAAATLADEEKGSDEAIKGLALLLPPPTPPRVLLRTSAAAPLEVRARRSIIEEGSEREGRRQRERERERERGRERSKRSRQWKLMELKKKNQKKARLLFQLFHSFAYNSLPPISPPAHAPPVARGLDSHPRAAAHEHQPR